MADIAALLCQQPTSDAGMRLAVANGRTFLYDRKQAPGPGLGWPASP